MTREILLLVKATIYLYKYRFSQDAKSFQSPSKAEKKIILLILDASCFKIRVDPDQLALEAS